MTGEHAQQNHGLGTTGAPRGLREKLLAATRPEFRGDEIVFPVDDPVFGSSSLC
ncbi:hypothetical protein [Streptomyces lunaelactis]|uniref:hypothetical protein n=1 Tax=Streptomyces lunaelactis TaxID=1535768 RepID=UPI00131F188E|nr:hypothetical protein [Streptomyces lunaelactis]NUK86969.1 hypothetical protein [Streptomyces lunaelactis]